MIGHLGILDYKGHLSVHWLFICRGLLRQEEALGLLTNIGDLDVVGRHKLHEQQAITGTKRHQHLYSNWKDWDPKCGLEAAAGLCSLLGKYCCTAQGDVLTILPPPSPQNRTNLVKGIQTARVNSIQLQSLTFILAKNSFGLSCLTSIFLCYLLREAFVRIVGKAVQEWGQEKGQLYPERTPTELELEQFYVSMSLPFTLPQPCLCNL